MYFVEIEMLETAAKYRDGVKNIVSWYAINTKPRQEDLVELSLRRLGLETFHPKLKQDKFIRRRRRTIIGPLFPAYLFARCNMATHYRAINYARGVRRVVSFGSDPAKVDEGMIESMKLSLQEGCVVIKPPSFTHGQPVRIQEGSFEGLGAIFEREMNDQQRVVLLLRALSYQARVVVDLKHVVNL